jgi:uncharacterized protein YeaO (DUF488 family)
LAPSLTLLDDYKQYKINWDEFKARFYEEMNNTISIKSMKEIKEMSKDKDIYLVCWEGPGKNCHRFILIDIINNMEVDVNV